jgi:outer membrane protein
VEATKIFQDSSISYNKNKKIKMKSVKLLALALSAVIISSFAANAQKIGSVNVDALVRALPEMQGVQEKMQQYQQDSIGGEYTRVFSEYKRLDSIVNSAATPKTVKETATKNRDEYAATLQDWQNIAGQAVQAKQAELLQPLYKKVMDAVNAVSKEKGYAYVLSQEAFVVAPESDNINLAVAQKLGLKVNQPAQKPATKPTGK